MSKEQALAFLKHAAENAELQAKIVGLAAQEGYTFSVEELTDAELEGAAGGTLGLRSFPKVEMGKVFPKVEMGKVSEVDLKVFPKVEITGR